MDKRVDETIVVDVTKLGICVEGLRKARKSLKNDTQHPDLV
jgi:hypothetical protein